MNPVARQHPAGALKEHVTTWSHWYLGLAIQWLGGSDSELSSYGYEFIPYDMRSDLELPRVSQPHTS